MKKLLIILLLSLSTYGQTYYVGNVKFEVVNNNMIHVDTKLGINKSQYIEISKINSRIPIFYKQTLCWGDTHLKWFVSDGKYLIKVIVIDNKGNKDYKERYIYIK